LQGDAVQADLLGVAASRASRTRLLKKLLRAAVRGDDLHAAAPGDTGVGNGPHLALLTVQGELVQDAAAALAGLCIWVAAHAVDAPAAGELQHVGAVLFVGIDHDLAQVLGGHAHDAGPQLAVFDEQARLDVVAAADPLVKARALRGCALVGTVGGGPADADLP
jgi:hypothetical protein